MVTVKLMGLPAQPLRVGITAIVPTKGAPVLFTGAVHEAILPIPVVAIPILALVLVHV